jgi:asparagine synthase (glutamine-hydrolysing)
MASASGRFTVAFNGEIYNHRALRSDLARAGAVPAAGWRGASDTETLLAAFEAWGIPATLPRLQGMFACAVWDGATQQLTLARDRLGEKPLYYGWVGAHFLFGSELPALRAHPSFRAELDHDAVTALLRLNHIPAPWSIYRGVRKLLPGTLLTVGPHDREGEPVAYWSAQEVVDAGRAAPWTGTPDEAVGALEALLGDVVGGQMASEVPVGAFLSGGFDSTAIVAMMQRQASRPVPTFAVGFDTPAYDETAHAAAVARHLGTAHTSVILTASDAREMIPRLATIYSEPFADASQLPTMLVTQMARRSVTVALAGDGGDELFGGYARYWQGERLATLVRWVPRAVRSMMASGIASLSAATWDRVLRTLPLPEGLASRGPQTGAGDQLLKGAALLTAREPAELYRGLLSA